MPDDISFAAELRDAPLTDALGERYLAYALSTIMSRCAATGTNDNLAFVSPKTGRAVSLSAGEAWRERLLALPRFLLVEASADERPASGEVGQGLALTGYFLERHVFAPHGKGLPAARVRLGERLTRA